MEIQVPPPEVELQTSIHVQERILIHLLPYTDRVIQVLLVEVIQQVLPILQTGYKSVLQEAATLTGLMTVAAAVAILPTVLQVLAVAPVAHPAQVQEEVRVPGVQVEVQVVAEDNSIPNYQYRKFQR